MQVTNFHFPQTTKTKKQQQTQNKLFSYGEYLVAKREKNDFLTMF